MNFFRASLAMFAMLFGTASLAETATNTMTLVMDGNQIDLLASPDFERAPSRWKISSAADYVHEIDIIGYLLHDDAIEMKASVRFSIWDLPDGLRIETPYFEIAERGSAGIWTTIDQQKIDDFDFSKAATVELSKYERTDAGMLLEGTFTGNPDHWQNEYKKPKERGPFIAASGDFSIFFPAP